MIKIDDSRLKMLKLNTKNFYVLADFDNTITAKECKTSMGIINSGIVKQGFIEEHLKICNLYKSRALESKDYAIKNEMWNKTLGGFFELFQKYDLTESMLEDIVKSSNIKFRDGFLEFLEFLYQEQIPIIIISAGVANCIEIFLKNNKAFFDNIYIISNIIKFNSQGFISELPRFIINPVNKNVISFSNEIREKIKYRENILLFGDVPGDIRMIENRDREKVLSIAFANKEENIE